jgi:translocation and assembly module TamB
VSRNLKIAAFTVLGLLLVMLAAGGALIMVAQSGWFKNKVRERIVSVAERATGGRVEIGRFDYDWHAFTAEVTPFILHGSEPASAPPLFRADKIQIGLKIISALKTEVDIASLSLTKPQLNVTVAPDGSSNIPSPLAGRSKNNWADQLLNLKVRRFEARDGMIVYNSQRFPLDLQADGFQTSVVYEISGPRYMAAISAREMRVSSPRIQTPLAFGFTSRFALERNAIRILDASVSSADWNVHAKGAIDNLSRPRASIDLTAEAGVKELKRLFGLQLEPAGDLSFDGRATVESSPLQYRFEGQLAGRGLGYVRNNFALRNVGLASRVEVTPSKARLDGLDLSALGGHFRGSAELLNFNRLAFDGAVQDLPLRALAQSDSRETGELNGILSGPVHFSGSLSRSHFTGIKAETRLDIVPGPQGVPLEGAVAIDYDQSAGEIRLGTSHVDLGSSHIAASGTLGDRLSVHLTSKNLNDFLPIFPLFGEAPPEQLPVELQGGSITFDGTVSGPLADPRIAGTADIGRFALGQRQFDRVTTAFDIGPSAADFRTLVIEQGKMRLEGQGRVSLQGWHLEDSSTVSALLSVSRADLKTLADQNGIETPVTGTVSGTVHVSGTFESPLASANVEAQNVTAYGEHFDTARADVTFTATALEVSNAELRGGLGRINASGAYNHTAHAWSDGSLRFEITSNRLNLAQIKHVQDFRRGSGGEVELRAGGTAKIVKGVVDLTSLNGRAGLRNAVVDGQSLGNVELTANTRLPVLALSATVNFGGIQMHGGGEWRLDSGYPGQARIEIPRVSFAALHELAPEPHLRKDLPFDGFLQGEVTLAGPLNNLAAWKAAITLSTVQLNAAPSARPMAGAQAQDLVLRNAEPVRLEGTPKAIEIRSASFVAKETTLAVSGRLALDSKTPWDVSAQGRINLSILQIFNPDLLASGESVISLRVQGPLSEPDVEGRLELQKASLFLRDFSNGVNDANGLILFDRNRATVQNLTAVTGGGKITFENGSFVGFRGEALVYRVQVTAENVRYRSQDGVSLTVNAALGLVGTSDNSVLSGSVTVMRTVFNPRTDVGSLLASTARPVSEPVTPNEYLRGIQFDVRVVSAPSLELETSLTRNIQADVNLRVRGTPDRPVILGGISVSSGEIEFFGNKYSINRGDVNFYNPSKIEPIIDMDLETKVRGIAVDISFSGSLNKLNFSYRSDPPLEANEILALLAVGRTPSTSGPLANSPTTTNAAYLATSSNPLLGQAIAPSSGRLEKFFGVGHIKIDPQLDDITSVPQARLTFEQQVSTEVTLTYITNLAVTNQQIVRIEWDLSKRWSVVALRDENGAFGIDFQFKKRYK